MTANAPFAPHPPKGRGLRRWDTQHDERPEGFAVDEWRVVLATLAPVSGGGVVFLSSTLDSLVWQA